MAYTCRREAGGWALRQGGNLIDTFPTLGALIAARLAISLTTGAAA